MSNRQRNQKYNLLTFVPVVLFNQFKFFYNSFFLFIALSQFYPPLKVGFMFTYIAPLAFVLSITLMKEAWDDIQRYRKDKDINNTMYEYLQKNGTWHMKASSSVKVGDILKINQNQRFPADCILLYTTERNGTVFIRTDQLDGETDWKLRKACVATQSAQPVENLIRRNDIQITANAPNDLIYDFKGTLRVGENQDDEDNQEEGLSLENTLWQNTVLASSGHVVA